MLGAMWILSLIVLAAMIFAIVDIVRRDDSQVKLMPKALWLILVILVPLIGIVLWFAIGREYPEQVSWPRPRAPRPAAAAPPAPSAGPARDTRTTEQQLADLEREIEEDRLRAELARRRAERGDGSRAS